MVEFFTKFIRHLFGDGGGITLIVDSESFYVAFAEFLYVSSFCHQVSYSSRDCNILEIMYQL
jgi:hypothetical protein